MKHVSIISIRDENTTWNVRNIREIVKIVRCTSTINVVVEMIVIFIFLITMDLNNDLKEFYQTQFNIANNHFYNTSAVSHLLVCPFSLLSWCLCKILMWWSMKEGMLYFVFFFWFEDSNVTVQWITLWLYMLLHHHRNSQVFELIVLMMYCIGC